MPATRGKGQIIGVFGTKGGVGRTVLACNLAIALKNSLNESLAAPRNVPSFQGFFGQRPAARQGAPAGGQRGGQAEGQNARVVLASLDFHAGGDLPLILGLNPNRNLADLATALDRSFSASLEDYLDTHLSGLKVLACPADQGAVGVVNAGHLELIFNLLREAFDYIILDMTPSFDPRMLMALNHSKLIILIASPDLPGVKHLKQDLETCRLHDIPDEKLEILINRAGIRGGIGLPEIQAELQKHPWAAIPVEEQTVTLSVNEGVPFVLSQPHSGVSLAVKRLGFKVIKILANKELPSGAEEGAMPAQQGKATPPPEESLRAENRLVELKIKAHQRVIEGLDAKEIDLGISSTPNATEVMRGKVRLVALKVVEELAEAAGLAREARDEMVGEIVDEIFGLGHLEGFLRDPEITEIMVNGPFQVYVERRGKLELTNKVFINDAQVMRIIERIVSPVGRRIDESSPMVDARLPDGSRVNAIIPPLALNGPILTIRKFSARPYTVADLIRFSSLSTEMAAFLQRCVEGRRNIIVSGGTGSGKTTLLNALSAFIPAHERILTIEDAAELRLQQQHVGRLEARPPNIEGKGAVAIRDLVRNALRMRPDRIIVGEVRGGEALDMLQAMNTGHSGSLTTVHANSPRDVLSRLETMVLMAGMDLPVRAIREQVASAIDLIVQQSRLRDGSRKITRITEVLGMEGEVITTQDLFVFKEEGAVKEGIVQGTFSSTGLRASFADASFSGHFLLPVETRGEG